MIVEVISNCYQEEFLMPLFMMHYEPWVDRITLLTNKYPDNRIVEEMRTGWINDAITRSQADWVVVVDIDELVFPPPVGRDARKTLGEEKADVIYCAMHQVWRHRTDADIDRLAPPILQRRHGEPSLSGFNGLYVKPCIFRPAGVKMGIGGHQASLPPHYVRGDNWSGAHWANADPCFCVERSCALRRDRLSDHNQRCGYGVQHHKSEEDIRTLCELHLDDPQVF